jgi:hypothetical protein
VFAVSTLCEPKFCTAITACGITDFITEREVGVFSASAYLS